MATRVVHVSLLASVALALLGTALADTVQKTTKGNKHCFVVAACPAGRQPNDTRNIHDFHVQVEGGTIVSHSSPTGWSGSHGKRSVVWETTTNPINFKHRGSKGGFCIRVDGGTRLIWRTTGKGGGTIAQGTINLP